MYETSNESNLDLTSKTGKEESRFESGISRAELFNNKPNETQVERE